MELKKRDKTNFYHLAGKKLTSFFKFIFNKKTKIILITLFIFFIFFIGNMSGLLISGFFGTFDSPSKRALDIAHYLGLNDLRLLKMQIEGLLAENIKIPLNYVKGQFSNPEKIFIDINFENYKRIEYKREQALKLGKLVSSGEDYVPATIRYKNKEVKVNLRLKGDMKDHWEGDKWSFRIKVDNDETLFGVKIFSIQDPKTRYHLNEPLYHYALGKEGILALRYHFVEVIINGENKGIYLLEEHFDKILIENNEKREGVILKFSEDFFNGEPLRIKNYLDDEFKWAKVDRENMGGNWFYGSNIETFSNANILDDLVLSGQFEEARNLLGAFRQGSLKTHQVFDTDKLAKYFAITTVLSCAHASSWNNIRFYYNPITTYLEPVGYDGGCGRERAFDAMGRFFPDCIGECNISETKQSDYFNLFFGDKIFFEKYIQELEKVSQQSYLDNLFLELEDEIMKNKKIIHKDNPFYHFSKETFYINQRDIEHKLNPIQSMNVYYQEELSSQNKIILYVGNLDFFPLEIINLIYNDSVLFELNQNEKILQPKISGPVNYQKFKFNIPSNFVWNDSLANNLKVNYKIFGLQKEMNQSVFPWAHFEEDFLEKDFIRQEPNIGAFEILEINEETKLIFIKKGVWNLNESIIIPPDYTVFCKPGTTINLIEEAMILSYSPISFSGTITAPIKIISSDKTGQGLAVLNADKESHLKYVYFENLKNPSKNNWELTGAITFYKSPVKFDNAKFLNLNSEDSLNIINSKYEIKNSIFKNCYSDCFDGDFSDGVFESISFDNCGNDCVDISGSVVYLENIEITNAGDKGISVGEKSNFSGEEIIINKGYIGVASKDSSNVKISNTIISNCDYDFAIYQKKSEFEHSSINAVGVDIFSSKNGNIIEKDSDFFLNDEIILGTKNKVYEELYPLEY